MTAPVSTSPADTGLRSVRTPAPRARVGRRFTALLGPVPSVSPVRARLTTALVWAVAAGDLALLHRTGLAAVLFFVIYPALWVTQRTRRAGALASTVFSLGIAVVLAERPGGSWGDALLNAGVYALFSLAMGAWFWHVYTMSGRLADSLARERATQASLRDAQAELVATEREAARVAERDQWAREVHDTLAQGYVSVITLSRAAGAELARGGAGAVASRLAQMEEVAQDNLAEARALVAGEGPTRLRSGLEDALGRLAQEQRAHGSRVALRVELAGAALTQDIQVVSLRTVQEALSNVTRHSGAGSVGVSARVEGGELVLAVTDDGVGTAGAPEGTGLSGMRARVEALGGTLTIDPEHVPDAAGRTGTVLEARIPLCA